MAADMTLGDCAAVVSSRRWLIVLPAVLTTAIALSLSLVQTPEYTASSEVLVQPRESDGVFNSTSASLNDRAIATELLVVEGEAVRSRVEANLALSEPPVPIEASTSGQTDAITLTAQSTNPANAQVLANAYAEGYIEVRREQSVDELLDASSALEVAIVDLREQIDALDPDDPDRAPLVAQAASFGTTLDELRVDATLRTGGTVLLRSAMLPEEPVSPTPLRTAALALVVGLILGLGAAFVLNYFDDVLRKIDDIRNISSLPILARIPHRSIRNRRPIALTDPHDRVVEDFRRLRTTLQFLALDGVRVLQVTSSNPGEGKSTVAGNLSVLLAEADNDVALVDADLRRPSIHEAMEIPVSPGVTELMTGGSPQEALRTVPLNGSAQLSVYPAGDVPADPSALLSGRRMSSLLDLMGQNYDFVVVDSPPVLPVSETVALARMADAVIVVVEEGRTRASELAETLQRLRGVSAAVVGFVINHDHSGARDRRYDYYDAAESRPDLDVTDEPFEPDMVFGVRS